MRDDFPDEIFDEEAVLGSQDLDADDWENLFSKWRLSEEKLKEIKEGILEKGFYIFNIDEIGEIKEE